MENGSSQADGMTEVWWIKKNRELEKRKIEKNDEEETKELKLLFWIHFHSGGDF
jgi:hypothetical protein